MNDESNDPDDLDVEGLEMVEAGAGLPPSHRFGRRGLHETNTWAKRAALPALGLGLPQVAVRLCKVSTNPAGPPLHWAIACSANLGAGLGPPWFDVRVGHGEDNYEWLALPPPPAGTCYVVQGHSVTVDLREGNAGAGTEAYASIVPADGPATLTP